MSKDRVIISFKSFKFETNALANKDPHLWTKCSHIGENGNMQSFHIPPPNDDLNKLTKLIYELCMDTFSNEEIISNIAYTPLETQKYIDLIHRVLQSEDPDKMLGASLHMAVENASNIAIRTNEKSKELLRFLLDELQKHQQKIQGY